MWITRTNTKRFVGTCSLCDWSTDVVATWDRSFFLLRVHAQTEHRLSVLDFQPKGPPDVKAPGKELPPQEKLTDYADHLVVFSDGKIDKMDTKFGKDQEHVKAMTWVMLDSGDWKNLGETPVFQKTLMHRIMEDGEGGPIGGRLTKGTERNPNEWDLVAVSSKADQKALDGWDEKAEAF